MSFADTGLDPQLLRAVAKRGLTKPTSVQLAAIPKALEGKDVVARARTGSGKTLAYLLPVLHKLLAHVGSSAAADTRQRFQAVVLVPTRELCEQVRKEAHEVMQYCGSDLQVSSLTATGGPALARAVSTAGHLVVATPGKLAGAIREGVLSSSVLESGLQTLVLDEADLLLTYGYEADLQLLAPLIPRSCQVMLMSATTSEALQELQRLVLHNPVALNLLTEAEPTEGETHRLLSHGGSGVSSTVTHWAFQCPREDRLLVTMATLKLGLVRRKVLIFVNSVDTAFRVKLFLETFGLRAALLNAEMPMRSRWHCLESFNKGVFDYLIATDSVNNEKRIVIPAAKRRKTVNGKHADRSKDEEYGVTRGIDFKGVHTILNFDLPESLQAYVHRAGRTGRAGQEGAALSLFAPEDEPFRAEITALLASQPAGQASAASLAATEPLATAETDSESENDPSERLVNVAGEGGAANGLRPFTRLSKAQVEALRYRSEDVSHCITKKVIKEARAKEIRTELLNSDKLKEYFESHQAERQLLRHDKTLFKVPQALALKHLPAYLKDPSLLTEPTPTGRATSRATTLGKRKKAKLPKPTAADKSTGVADDSCAAGLALSRGKVDPLKSIKSFHRPPKRGSHADEQLTDMERRAMAAGLKEAKQRAKAEGKPFQPKRNVRRFKRHR